MEKAKTIMLTDDGNNEMPYIYVESDPNEVFDVILLISLTSLRSRDNTYYCSFAWETINNDLFKILE